jgi:hypothetical protein
LYDQYLGLVQVSLVERVQEPHQQFAIDIAGPVAATSADPDRHLSQAGSGDAATGRAVRPAPASGPVARTGPARRMLACLVEEHDAAELPYSIVRDYLGRRRPEI